MKRCLTFVLTCQHFIQFFFVVVRVEVQNWMVRINYYTLKFKLIITCHKVTELTTSINREHAPD